MEERAKKLKLEEIENLNILKDTPISIELLKSQGFNNISYLIKTNNKSYVLRVFKSAKSVNISREFEYHTQKIANSLKIAPKPIFINKEFMIYEYLKGIHKEQLSINEIKNLSFVIKKIHSIKLKTKPYNLKKDFKMYEKLFKDEKNLALLKELKIALRKAKKITNKDDDLVLSHFDLNPNNIIFFKNTIKIIDWEYAGTNDRFFDLASICVEFKLDKKEEKLFLKSYFKNINPTKEKLKKYQKKLKIFKIIYKNFCILWFNSQV